MARVDTVASSSMYVLVEEAVLAEYTVTLKRKIGQTKVTEVSISKPLISGYFATYVNVLGQN